MDTSHRHHPPAPGGAHGETDVHIRGILNFLVGLAVCTVLVCLALIAMFRYLQERYATQPNPQANVLAKTNEPLAPEKMLETFPEPRLQPNGTLDLATRREKENERLSGYTWVDRNAGVVQIPVERAMELTLERGLPALAPGKQPTPGPKTAPAEAPAATPAAAAAPAPAQPQPKPQRRPSS